MTTKQKHFDVIIIGAGFCGISCGAGLKQFGIENFIILEKGDCIGYFWKTCTYDRLHLHTPYHDLPHDKGLVYNYPKYKSRKQVIDYLQKYSKLHKLSSKFRFDSNVTNINKVNKLWHITYLNQSIPSTLTSKYLVIATSTFREAFIPKNLLSTMKHFNGDIIHSSQFKNSAKYQNQNMLVVGNGNSACEICIDAVEHNVNKIVMISRRARHFIPLQAYEHGEFRKMVIGKFLGIWDVIHSKLFRVTKKHRKWRKIVNESKDLSVDLSKYGIQKPKLSRTEETAEGNNEVIDIGFIPLMKQQRVNVVNKGGVEKFEGDKIHMQNGEILEDKFDVVVLCTGFKHGLEKLFDEQIFDEYFYDKSKGNECELYSRYDIFPKTNGFNRALNDDSLYFASFDQPITGGLARGLAGWDIARKITKSERKYSKDRELSHWNYVNTLAVSGVAIGSVCLFGLIGACAHKYLKKSKL